MREGSLHADVEQDPSLGLALCRLARGLDDLYRRARQTGGEAALAAEGLVPVDLWGGLPLPLADWSAAESAVRELQSFTPRVTDRVRQAFLEDTLRSLETLVNWQAGVPLPFRTKAERLLGLRIEPVPISTLASWRKQVLDRIGPAGDSPATTIFEWEATERVPPQDLRRVTTEILMRARDLARERIGELPARPLMGLDLVHDVPYTAYCDYPSNTIHLNAGQAFSRARLELLLLHEAYPGHDFHLAWRERDVRLGRQPVDSLLVITNTPSSPLFEGIGDNGATFLDWPVTSEQRQLGRLRSAACVNACLMLHEDAAPVEQVREFLIEEGCGQPAWAATRVRFMLDPLRAPFVFAYFLGDECVASAAAAWRGPRTDFYTCLYGQMHSPRSLQLAVELDQQQRSSIT
jgi:hypothetical protein